MGKARSRSSKGADRPTPVQAIEAGHRRQSAAFGSRADRFSQLVARLLRDEHASAGLVTTSGLTEEEHAELARIAPEAHRGFRTELTEALAKLRDLLPAAGDPFYILSVVQDLNLIVPWGDYFEPTHEGLEFRVELVAGLLATEPRATQTDRPSPAAVQAVLDEVDHVLQVILLFNLSMPRAGDLEIATLRFTTATRWMSVRGASFPSHGEELATEVYGPIADWLVSTFGFDIGDVIKVGMAAVDLIADRRNATGAAAAEAANAEMLSDPAREPFSDEAQVKAMLVALRIFEDGLRDGHVLTADQLCEKNPSLDHNRAEAVLRELSVAIGSLPPESYTGLYDQNPLRERPFLEFGGE